MSTTLQTEHALTPVPALAFLDLDQLYILAGEGPYLKVFEHQTRRLLSTHRIFESKNIHGITCSVIDHKKHSNCASVLVWGGRSVCVLELSSGNSATGVRAGFPITVLETKADDWILDGCFRPYEGQDYMQAIEAVLVTAHNLLVRLEVTTDSEGIWHQISAAGSGPRSMLYSAHISWSEMGRVLIAAGTVLGEVHLWSMTYDSCWDLCDSHLHHTFTGHQGSVFGVRISEKVGLSEGSVSRMLASCSDDRTIRVWDISELKKRYWPDVTEPTTQSLAMTMGHASRIWSVRFEHAKTGPLQLHSFGEDGTTQAWSLEPSVDAKQHKNDGGVLPFTLTHSTKYGYHSGKNLWAPAVYEHPDDACFVATGGADGRIVSYLRKAQDSTKSDGTVSSHCTIDEIARSSESVSKIVEAITDKKAVFDSLRGTWDLSRTLRSSSSTYPSGTLTGTAKFDQRPATDPAFDDEFIYYEEGDFVAETGFTMKATRQYAYRYQREPDRLTAWFVKAEGQGIVDYLFHHLNFVEDREDHKDGKAENDNTTLRATGHHLCIGDDYTPEYSFVFAGQMMKEWRVKYTVKGPHKDYVADARYTRPPPEAGPVHVDAPNNSMGETDRAMQNRTLKADSFKSYAWLSKSEFLTVTEQGSVSLGTINTKCAAESRDFDVPAISWEAVGSNEDFKSSSIMTSVPSLGVVFLAGASGNIYRYRHHGKALRPFSTGHRKSTYLKAQHVGESWQKAFEILDLPNSQCWVSFVMTSLGCDLVTAFIHPLDEKEDPVDTYSMSIVGHRSSQLPKGFIVTSSCILDDSMLVVLGSRNGDLCFFDPLVPDPEQPPECVLVNTHNQDAVMTIQVLPDTKADSDSSSSCILTTGRDGRFAVHRISRIDKDSQGAVVTFNTVHESMPPFGPNIEGAHFDTTTRDLFLWGFRSKDFVVWNETQKTEVMTVECGGAHRHWAYSPLDDGKGGGSFVWTKASVCHIRTQSEASHEALQAGGHGREIKAMAVSPRWGCHGSQRRLIATGAEDTALRIFDYESASGSRCLNILTKHSTGIQKLQWSFDGRHLFSAAGCEEFLVWRISSVPLIGIGAVCLSQCPTVTESKDLRIMDFAVLDVFDAGIDADYETYTIYLVSMVYSDSSVRIFHLHETDDSYSFSLLLEGSYTTHCLTQATHIHLSPNEWFLCTSSTDGHLAFWPLTKALKEHGYMFLDHQCISWDPEMASDSPTTTISWQHPIPIHQNSIKSLAHVKLSDRDILMVTGGDDQSLAFTRLTIRGLSSTNIDFSHATLLLPNAHASAVTAVTSLGDEDLDSHIVYRFASVGNDQRLKTWDLVHDLEQAGVQGLRFKKGCDKHTTVADASAMEGFRSRDEEDQMDKVCVVGIGMETWSVDGGTEGGIVRPRWIGPASDEGGL